ncbi:N-acetylmuramoyl-L-alanine amidase [Kitasatospora fiedleri]|uniref:N-acetylmuramoyl-L-alanine amidase n=1 Tax=Kitasatospora fiedleri TaxID=2991545 RepID=UPI00249A0D85|nr:peptidoglycan recognition family protein [Kitasatospora fiedleri]
MARMAGTAWIGPTPNQRAGGMSEFRGLVLHIQDGTEAGSEAWFKNPDSQASAHFLNPKSGGLRQLVDTADRAWTQGAGNAYWISVENEGRGGDALTSSQVENCAQLLAWLHRTYGVPLQLADDPNGRGLGWHGMGGAAWGGHYDCPGKAVLAQRGQILARTQQIINPTPTTPVQEDDMPSAQEVAEAVWSFRLPDPDTPGRGVAAGDIQAYSDHRHNVLYGQLAGLSAAVKTLAGLVSQGVDTAAVVAAVEQAIAKATVNVHVDVNSTNSTPKGN